MILIPKCATKLKTLPPYPWLFWPIIKCNFEPKNCHKSSRTPSSPSPSIFRFFWTIINCDLIPKGITKAQELTLKTPKVDFLPQKYQLYRAFSPLYLADNQMWFWSHFSLKILYFWHHIRQMATVYYYTRFYGSNRIKIKMLANITLLW